MTRRVISRQALVRVLGGAGVAATAAMLYLWFALLSPFAYAPQAGLEPIDPGRRHHRVFAYGTLQYAPVQWLVIGRTVVSRAAALPGCRVDGLNVVSDAAVQAAGVVFEVTAAELLVLDRFERRGVRYERVALPLDDGQTAWVYRRLSQANLQADIEPPRRENGS